MQVRPDGVDGETERFTVPVSPLVAVMETFAAPEEPARIWLGLTDPAEIEKSTTWKRMVGVVWDSVALRPVTVTV